MTRLRLTLRAAYRLSISAALRFRPVGDEFDLSVGEDASPLWPLAKDVGTRLGELAAGHAVDLGLTAKCARCQSVTLTKLPPALLAQLVLSHQTLPFLRGSLLHASHPTRDNNRRVDGLLRRLLYDWPVPLTGPSANAHDRHVRDQAREFRSFRQKSGCLQLSSAITLLHAA